MSTSPYCISAGSYHSNYPLIQDYGQKQLEISQSQTSTWAWFQPMENTASRCEHVKGEPVLVSLNENTERREI